MKRAWPYALALAVVVTGCYLALAPLLRSLSPAPTGSATSQLSQVENTVTVGKSPVIKQITFRSPEKGSNLFVARTHVKKKAAKKTVKKTSTPPAVTTDQSFAGNAPSSSGSSSSSSSSSGSSSSGSSSATPSTPAKAPTKPAQKKSGGVLGNGTVIQTQSGDSGLAGGNDSGSSSLGQKPDVGG